MSNTRINTRGIKELRFKCSGKIKNEWEQTIIFLYC